ncbi:MAG: DUF4097 family beta strand repeat-containing protein [Candidatus Zixiibacteriota bacterium]
MNQVLRYLANTLLLLVFMAGLTMAKDNEKKYEFGDINSIKISAMTGSIKIHSGDVNKIIVDHRNDMEKPEKLILDISANEGTLFIDETYGENSPKGRTSWDISIPKDLKMKSIECFSGLDFIEIGNVDVEFIKGHAATGDMSINSVKSKEMALTTTSGFLTVEKCEISDFGTMVSSGGDVTVELPYIPVKKLHTASTSADTYLTIDDFGENFDIIIRKNKNQGEIRCPFECTESYTKRFDKNDTFETDYCIIKHGRGGPGIDMLTGYGKIIINEGAQSGK